MSLPGYTEYWRSQANKSQKNTPKQYTLKHRSINVTNSIKSLNLNKDVKILELGCNVGRNLQNLFTLGYTNLHGVEINAEAIKLGKTQYPELYEKIYVHVGRCKDILSKINEDYDIIYTQAVLLHIDDDERKIIYDYMMKHCTYVIAIEPNNIDKMYIKEGRMFNTNDVLEQLENRGFTLINKHIALNMKNNYDVIIIKKLVAEEVKNK